MIHIAVVEDNEDLRDEVVFHLGRMGHCVTGLPDGTALDRHLASQPTDVLVLDLGLPGEDGVSIARRLAVSHPRLAIAMLTARGQLEDRLVGLESGADIYLVKPVDMRELSAVCESLYRRLHRVDVPERPAEGWQLDMQSLELVPPGGAPGLHQIISSNGVLLAALLGDIADVHDAGIARDDRDALRAAVASEARTP